MNLILGRYLRLFDKISKLLEGKTNRVVISFADPYKKITKKLESIEYIDILDEKKKLYELAKKMSEIAISRGISVESCSEAIDLDFCNIKHGKCIDDKLIEDIFNIELNLDKDKNQRQECGCVKSVDIGIYNTCSHGCTYCYATFSDNTVEKNKLLHDPLSPLLIGTLEDIDEKIIKKLNSDTRLF